MNSSSEKLSSKDLNEILVSTFEYLHNKKILLLLPLLFIGLIIFINLNSEIMIFPSNNYKSIEAYVDTTELDIDTTTTDGSSIYDTTHGTSDIIKFHTSDTIIDLSFILRHGIKYPYTGVSFNVYNSKDSALLDLSKYDSLTVGISTENSFKGINLTIVSFWEGVTNLRRDPATGRVYQNYLPINSKKETDTTIALEKFITPEWWFEKYQIPVVDRPVLKRDLKRCFSFSIENSDYEAADTEINLKITHLSVKKSTFTINILSFISLLIYLLLYGYFWKYGASHIGGPVVIPYHELKVASYVDEDSQKIEEYIATNYSDAELTVKQASIDTGVAQAKIQVILRTQFHMTFRQYLNKIKVHEAKRLLLETDRQVTDIAYKIGYKNVTHFNRVFKEVEEVSPNQFRKANK